MSGPDTMPPRWGGLEPPTEEPPLEAGTADREPGPWGPGATMLWLAAMLTAILGATFMIVMPYLALFHPGELGQEAPEAFLTGDINWIVIVVSWLFAAAVLLLALYLRRGYDFRRYLALRPAGWRHYLIGALLLAGFNLGAGAMFRIFEVESPAWMEAMYSNIRFWPGLLFAILLWSPLWEELVFRGFVYAGLQAKMGSAAAILVPALLFTLIHLTQYDWHYLIVIFGLGLIFGIARWRSGSVLVPIALHALNNLLASLQLLMLQ